MICPKCGNDIGNSLYCNNCNTYPFKDKEPVQSKKTSKITGITIGCFVLFICILIGASVISDNNKKYEKMNDKYDETYQAFLNGEYYSVISDIKEFNESANKENNTLSEKYEDLYQQTEAKIYDSIFSSTDNEEVATLCGNYIEYFPNGIHISEVDKKYAEILNVLAPMKINEAKQSIDKGEYLEANRILNSIVNNDKISKQYINEAKGIKNNISKIVEYETPVSASIQDLLTDAEYYNMRKITLTTDVVVTSVDRERKMLYTCAVSDDDVLGYDYSFAIEIYYGNMYNQSRWGSLSAKDKIKLNFVSGRFKIYSNRNNSGYIDAESIG